jgi:hypothetical protein
LLLPLIQRKLYAQHMLLLLLLQLRPLVKLHSDLS